MRKRQSIFAEQKVVEVKKASRIRLVSPSTEPVDKTELLSYVQELSNAGADFIHCDIMDGIAVEKVTYNEKTLMLIRKKFPNLRLDVHLMTAGGSKTVKKYIHSKPFAITVQYDYFSSEKDLVRALKAISKTKKIKCGISVSLNVPISYITPYLKYIDLVLIMGVQPGKGGQKMNKDAITKVREARHIKETLKNSLMISFLLLKYAK